MPLWLPIRWAKQRLSHPLSLALIAVALLATSLLVPVPFRGRVSSALMDLIHAPAFATLAWLVCRAAAPWLSPSWWRKLLEVALPLGICGLAAEFAQSLVGRGASWHDARANLLGACAGVLFFHLQHGPRPTARWGWWAGIVGLFGLASIAPAFTLVDSWRQTRQFPLLASFASRLEVDRFVAQDARLRRVTLPSRAGQGALEIQLLPGLYPGVALLDMNPDWTGFEFLAFDLHIDEGAPLDVIVKIHDRDHRRSHFAGDDRFDGIFLFEPGWHRVRIPLTEVRAAPRGRSMNMAKIDTWQLFTYDLRTQNVLANLRLEPNEQTVEPSTGGISGSAGWNCRRAIRAGQPRI